MLNPPDRSLIAAVYLTSGPDLDLHSARALFPRLKEAIEQTARTVVLDCSKVEFMDSSGLRLLLEATRLAQTRGVSFVVSRPAPSLRRLFQMAGVSEYLEFEEPELTAAAHHDVDRRLSSAGVHSFPVAHLG